MNLTAAVYLLRNMSAHERADEIADRAEIPLKRILFWARACVFTAKLRDVL